MFVKADELNKKVEEFRLEAATFSREICERRAGPSIWRPVLYQLGMLNGCFSIFYILNRQRTIILCLLFSFLSQNQEY